MEKGSIQSAAHGALGVIAALRGATPQEDWRSSKRLYAEGGSP